MIILKAITIIYPLIIFILLGDTSVTYENEVTGLILMILAVVWGISFLIVASH